MRSAWSMGHGTRKSHISRTYDQMKSLVMAHISWTFGIWFFDFFLVIDVWLLSFVKRSRAISAFLLSPLWCSGHVASDLVCALRLRASVAGSKKPITAVCRLESPPDMSLVITVSAEEYALQSLLCHRSQLRLLLLLWRLGLLRVALRLL